MKKLIVASKNQGKVKEFKKMMADLPFEIVALDSYPNIVEPEETGKTFMDNARLKAAYYAEATGEMCLADDSGLEVYALEGAPGVLSARYAGEHGGDAANNRLVLQNMREEKNRGCRFFCALALANTDGVIELTSEGTCEGELLHEEKGDGGFGYDPLFFSLDLSKSLAEASAQEKNSVSHRSRALKELVKLMGEKYAHRDNG